MQEWAITKEGRVVLSLDGRLGGEPVRAALMPRGGLVVATADGLSLRFVPDRKVAGALRLAGDVVITEPASGPERRRTTVLATRADEPAPGPRA